MKRRIGVLDLETGGMKEDGAHIVELALIIVDPDLLMPVPNNSDFSVFVRYDPAWFWDEKAAQKTHQYTRKFLWDHGKPEAEAIQMFLDFLHSHGIKTWQSDPDWWTSAPYHQRSQLVPLGQNVNFDLSFLETWIGKGTELFTYKPLDTMHSAAIIQEAHKKAFGYHEQPFRDPEEGFPSVSLSAIGNAFGLDTEGAHGALYDCHLALESWRYMVQTLSIDFRNSREYTAQQEEQRRQAEEESKHGASYEKPKNPTIWDRIRERQDREKKS